MADKPSIAEWKDYRPELVEVSNLFVDKEYQRRISEGLVEDIAWNYIPPIVQTLCVSARKESGSGDNRKVTSGAVFDGQQRLEGIRRRNKLIERREIDGALIFVVPAIVYSGLDQAGEAQLFEWIQVKRRNMTSYDRFRASLVAGNEESLAIKELTEECGYEVGYSGETDIAISAVSALEQMYRRDPDVLERALIIFRGAWKTNYIPQAAHLRGMGRFLRDNPGIDDEKLVRRMFITSPTDLEKKEINARELSPSGKRSDQTMAAAITSIYGIRESSVEAQMRKMAA